MSFKTTLTAATIARLGTASVLAMPAPSEAKDVVAVPIASRIASSAVCTEPIRSSFGANGCGEACCGQTSYGHFLKVLILDAIRS